MLSIILTIVYCILAWIIGYNIGLLIRCLGDKISDEIFLWKIRRGK